MIILHQYPPLTSHPSGFISNKLVHHFFPPPDGVTNNYMHSPHDIILLSVTFPNLQSIALRANFKKGEQSVSSNRNTSTIQECCHPHENIHVWVEEKRQGQTATYVCKAMCIHQNVTRRARARRSPRNGRGLFGRRSASDILGIYRNRYSK